MISFVAQPLYSDLVFSDMGVVAGEVADPRPVQNEAARIYLVMTSRVVKQPHGLVVEFPIQFELVLEVGVEGKPTRRHELDEPALAEGEDALAVELGAAQDNDLGVRGAVGGRDAADRAEDGVAEDDVAPGTCPGGRLITLRRCQNCQDFVERYGDHRAGVATIEVVVARSDPRRADEGEVEHMDQHVRAGLAHTVTQRRAEGVRELRSTMSRS